MLHALAPHKSGAVSIRVPCRTRARQRRRRLRAHRRHERPPLVRPLVPRP
jgi:hypothetical protein